MWIPIGWCHRRGWVRWEKSGLWTRKEQGAVWVNLGNRPRSTARSAIDAEVNHHQSALWRAPAPPRSHFPHLLAAEESEGQPESDHLLARKSAEEHLRQDAPLQCDAWKPWSGRLSWWPWIVTYRFQCPESARTGWIHYDEVWRQKKHIRFHQNWLDTLR